MFVTLLLKVAVLWHLCNALLCVCVCVCVCRILDRRTKESENYLNAWSSPFAEANTYSVSQEIPHVLWKPTSHYRVHKRCHWTLSWTRWIQSAPWYPFSVTSTFLVILPSTPRSPKWSLPFKLYNLNSICISHLYCTSWPCFVILSDLPTVTTFGEECKLWRIGNS
jgi:hypothetical protein